MSDGRKMLEDLAYLSVHGHWRSPIPQWVVELAATMRTTRYNHGSVAAEGYKRAAALLAQEVTATRAELAAVKGKARRLLRVRWEIRYEWQGETRRLVPYTRLSNARHQMRLPESRAFAARLYRVTTYRKPRAAR